MRPWLPAPRTLGEENLCARVSLYDVFPCRTLDHTPTTNPTPNSPFPSALHRSRLRASSQPAGPGTAGAELSNPVSMTPCYPHLQCLTHVPHIHVCTVSSGVPSLTSSLNTTGRLVHIGNKTYAACDTYRDCAEMSGGRLVNECFSRTLPNGTGATAKVAICSCMGFAGFIPQIDEEPCWEARCNVGTKTCLTRHVEGYFNLVSAGRGGRWCIVAENATLEWQEPACSSLKNRHLYASTHIREHFLLILSLSHTHTHILIPAFPPHFPPRSFSSCSCSA